MKSAVFLYAPLWLGLFYAISAKKQNHKGSKGLDGRIVGGYNATIQDYPYQVYLLMQKGGSYYQCGGSLISARYVLTAAHCLVGVTAVYVRAGSTDSDSGGKLYYTYFYRIHPRYNAATSDYDVALVDLRRDVQLDGTLCYIVQPELDPTCRVTAVYVRAGSTDSDSGGRLYYTYFYRIHPRYNAATSDYDVALVDLRRDVQLDGTLCYIVQPQLDPTCRVTAVYVRAGSTDSDSGGRLYYTYFYRIHPRYNAATSDYDVALVDLRRDVQLDGTTTRTIPMIDQASTLAPGTEVTVSGWGTTAESGATSSSLMAVRVPVVSAQECRRAYGSSQITTRMFCAGLRAGGKDSCQGDSGGPAAVDNGGTLVGIVSYGNGCARAGYPGVYTSVASVRAWIRANSGV